MLDNLQNEFLRNLLVTPKTCPLSNTLIDVGNRDQHNDQQNYQEGTPIQPPTNPSIQGQSSLVGGSDPAGT